MQALSLRNDTLIEIATFLVRRWSGNDKITVEFSDKTETKTRLNENRVILMSMKKLHGNNFQKYRQFRTSLWIEAMRIRFCKKILSNDHAFGFILNTLETRRIELLGRKIWMGMDKELIFDYSFKWIYRPMLNTVYGKARVVEAFFQHFLMGSIKGEMQASNLIRVAKASEFAKKILKDAVEKNYDTEWLEKKIPEIIKILDIDSLITIPLSVPLKGPGFVVSPQDLLKALIKASKNRENDIEKVDPKDILEGREVFGEYNMLLEENKKNENIGLSTETIGVRTPSGTNVDETKIYDINLITNLKTKFKEWKTGWKEQHVRFGDEFDEEAYIEGHNPFFTDKKKVIKTKIVMLLDHSSSISADQLEYKKATLALCEVLSYLKVKFAVYAFSTENKQVVCWQIKSDSMKWNYVAAKRLAQIVANGGTPLAEVYDKMFPILRSQKPDIFLTLSDGEPSDPDAVRSMVKAFRQIGVKMVALGLGPDTTRAIIIANNLKYLGFERTLAVSRLNEIPNRVISVLGSL